MPELPEIETIVRQLKIIENKKISDAKIVDEGYKVSKQDLKKIVGQKIIQVKRIGKSIAVITEKLNKIFIHLGITGLISIKSNKYTKIKIILEDISLFINDKRKFGKVLVDKKTTSYGPDPLIKKNHKNIIENIIKRKLLDIKSALMDQKIIGGIGNIYANECLFYAKIRPHAKNLAKKDIQDILKNLSYILNKSISLGGCSFRDFVDIYQKKGCFQKMLKVYMQKTCKACKNKITKITLKGRSTYFCNRCQTIT